jgi:hypothetical protein
MLGMMPVWRQTANSGDRCPAWLLTGILARLLN